MILTQTVSTRPSWFIRYLPETDDGQKSDVTVDRDVQAAARAYEVITDGETSIRCELLVRPQSLKKINLLDNSIIGTGIIAGELPPSKKDKQYGPDSTVLSKVRNVPWSGDFFKKISEGVEEKELEFSKEQEGVLLKWSKSCACC